MYKEEDIANAIKKSDKLAGNVKTLLLDVLEGKKNLIFYGAGNQGFICEDIIVNSLGISVRAFMISDGQAKQIKWNTLLPIYHVSELAADKNDLCVLFTMGYQNADKLAQGLRQQGWQNLCVVNDWEVCNEALREISLRLALAENGYELRKNENFLAGNYKFVNPFRNSLTFSMFVRECENIISDRILGRDTSLNKIDSPYEYGNVRMQQGDVVIDCGANIGLFSALAASIGCQVFAFEPVDFIAETTRAVAELYDGRITVLTEALSDKVGEIDFWEADERNSFVGDSSTVFQKDLSGGNFHQTKKKATTIDEIVEQYGLNRVDFVKADIEGAERFMLRGARKTLQKFAPKLAICTYHLPDDREVITDIILNANPDYVIEYKWDKLYAYVRGKDL